MIVVTGVFIPFIIPSRYRNLNQKLGSWKETEAASLLLLDPAGGSNPARQLLTFT